MSKTSTVSCKGGSWGLLHDISAYGHTNSERSWGNTVFIFAQLKGSPIHVKG